ncbi:hypothetical protein QBC40DRAFT_201183 [Triangularia verruculosa]|uniref:Aminoglycoside phosphotransferase domain-containing protein n=1 Tax=Triangularia verruculosa TaxID=2587418 RepID=A0AAN6XH05_9PEZI|nr:hypothetical protein QBC40DRAFT_201183 [Triangularia verruculosa]
MSPTPTNDQNAAVRQFAQTLEEDEELFKLGQYSFRPFFTYPPNSPRVFVKVGGVEFKQGEGDMQRIAYEWMRRERERDPTCNIYVPEVFKIFTKGGGLTFIIMELLDKAKPVEHQLRTLDGATCDRNEPIYYRMIADGIHRLSRIPVPQGATPGPFTLGERRIKHILFKDHEAPIVYPTVQDLEDHLNRIVLRMPKYRRTPDQAPRITFERDLTFCYTDFNDENFMIETEADGRPRLYIIDFEHASFLPISFLAHAVYMPQSLNRWEHVTKWVAERFGHSLPQTNVRLMDEVRALWVMSVSKIGLTEAQRQRSTIQDAQDVAGCSQDLVPHSDGNFT